MEGRVGDQAGPPLCLCPSREGPPFPGSLRGPAGSGPNPRLLGGAASRQGAKSGPGAWHLRTCAAHACLQRLVVRGKVMGLTGVEVKQGLGVTGGAEGAGPCGRPRSAGPVSVLGGRAGVQLVPGPAAS